MKILFVCSYGQVRSRAAYALYKDQHDCRFLGLDNRAHEGRIIPESEWADLIFIMTRGHMYYYKRYWPHFKPKLRLLEIKDLYGDWKHPELHQVLKKKIDSFLRRENI